MSAFLLSREWREQSSGIELTLWARSADGPVRVRLRDREAVMFVARQEAARADRRAEVQLESPAGEPVDALYFRSQRAMLDARDVLRAAGVTTFESDVKPHDRFLMERFVTGGLEIRGRARQVGNVAFFDDPAIRSADVHVPLSIVALDIETDGFDGPLLSAALASATEDIVFVRGAGEDDATVRFVPDERTLLARLFAEIRRFDPDVLAGWNVVEFDLRMLETRARALGVDFALGRANERARVLVSSTADQLSIARIPGRVVLDGIATLKSATHRFERFTLEHVAREVLGRGKRIAPTDDPMAEIRRMHQDDPHALAAYNLEDCRLVLDIFTELELVDFAMERARLTGLPMDRPGGSVAAFDHLYLPRLHRRGVVAHDVDHQIDLVASPGGYVLESVPGLYENVLSFDFRSLYPSIIRTFRIDPLGLYRPGDDPLPGEDGATFARAPEGSILPELVAMLHEARAKALAEDRDALSQAIKILMNSLYGVLGTPGCRFFDARLPTSITRRGHAVIERARRFFVDRGMDVLYGDTDSLFVHLTGSPSEDEARARGKALAAEVTATLAAELRQELRIDSFLEMRFESHYLRFLLPTTRGTQRGSKKRYAGLVRKAGEPSVIIRGLEAVRTDWSPIARRVQRELLERVFTGQPYAEWLEALAKELSAGAFDEELVFRRRARGEMDGAALVMTTSGLASPTERSAPIDYAHYLDKQLAPACDVVLSLLGTSFDRVAGVQASLF